MTEKRFRGYYEDRELPLKRGQMVTIKKGTIVKTLGKEPKPAGKTYKVKVHHFMCGQTETKLTQDKEPPHKFIEEKIHKMDPTVEWAGPGGYWTSADLNDIPEAMAALPSLDEVVRRIDWKAADWAGNCYAVACAIVKAGLVKGVAVYGHWLGPVAPGSFFGGKEAVTKGRSRPFIRHGWVLLDDGRILDPTRWGFDGKEPYLHVGPADAEEYDEGGNDMRVALRRPPPAFDPTAKTAELSKSVLPSGTWKFVESLLEIDYLDGHQVPGTISIEQLYWLANLPIQELGPIHAPVLYEAFEKIGHGPAIPLDNRQMAKRMKKTG